MTKREKFRAVFNQEKTDSFCQLEHGFWDETFLRWQHENLPSDVIMPDLFLPSPGDLFSHFNILKCGYIRPYIYMYPQLPHRVLEETDDYIISVNGNGVTNKEAKSSISLPQQLDFSIKNGADYAKYRDRLTNPNLDARIDKYAKTAMEGYGKKQDDAAVCIHMDGFFAYPRELMGVERTLYAFYDEPEFMHELINDRAELYIQLYEPILQTTELDFAFIWEDMCFKNGPLVSPDIFEEFMLPAYRKVISFLHDFNVKNVVVDSDGDVTKLIPLWLKSGVTGLLPFEVQSGMDVVALGEMFPELVIIGGINKYMLFEDKAQIDAELNRVLPAMAERGKYIPTLDHWVPPEISYENFCYYVEKVRNFKL